MCQFHSSKILGVETIETGVKLENNFSNIADQMMIKQNNKKIRKQKKSILNCLRILLIAVCFSVFMIISFELLDNYFSGKVTVSSDWDYDNKLTQVKPPMVVICARDPFGKGTDLREMFTIEEYMQKSINVTKAVVKMVSINSNYTNEYLVLVST